MTYKCTSTIVSRLKRVEGQVKGLIRMSEEGRPCEEILLQIKAVQSALSKVGGILYSEHIDVCVREAIKKGKGDEAIDRLKDTLRRAIEI